MTDKVRYFLKAFSGLEWSGPAWYSHDKDEKGFPTNIKLEYFHPLDLGTSASTDWDGANLLKIYKALRKEFPKIGKEWVQGNIHSHHGMGAFYSGTDVQQCIDGANENFYYSLVVSTKIGKEFHFGVSYPDQFNKIHVVEIDDIECTEVKVSNKDWNKQAKFIKGANKATGLSLFKRNNNNEKHNYQLTQGVLWDNKTKNQEKTPINDEDISSKYEEHLDWLSYNGGEEVMEWPQWEKYDTIMHDFTRGRLTSDARNRMLKEIGVDEYGRTIS